MARVMANRPAGPASVETPCGRSAVSSSAGRWSAARPSRRSPAGAVRGWARLAWPPRVSRRCSRRPSAGSRRGWARAVVAFLIGLVAMRRKAARVGVPLTGAQGRRFALSLAAPLVAGAALDRRPLAAQRLGVDAAHLAAALRHRGRHRRRVQRGADAHPRPRLHGAGQRRAGDTAVVGQRVARPRLRRTAGRLRDLYREEAWGINPFLVPRSLFLVRCLVPRASCSVRCVVRRAACGVRRAACVVRRARAACSVRRAACGVRRAACGALGPACGLRRASCGVAACDVPRPRCRGPGATCRVRRPASDVPRARCDVPRATCRARRAGRRTKHEEPSTTARRTTHRTQDPARRTARGTGNEERGT